MKKGEYQYGRFPVTMLQTVCINPKQGFTDIYERVFIKDIPAPSKGVPICNLKKSILEEFCTDEKSDNEIYQFLAYLAISSIVGKAKFRKTNKVFIVCRMIGCNKQPKLDELTKEQRVVYDKFVKDNEIIWRQFDKVLDKLKLNWKVTTYSNRVHGLYVGINANIEEIVEYHMTKKNKDKDKLKEIKNKEQKAIQTVLNKLRWKDDEDNNLPF